MKRGIPSIAYTYNEPAVFFEYAFDTARLAHEAGLRNIFVSSGFETLTALDAIAPYLDAVNLDLKAFSDATYRTYCDARLDPVLRNIRHLVQDKGIWTEVTTLVIPGLNDSDAELRACASYLADISPDLPWHVSAFHPDYLMRDRPPTPAATLRRGLEDRPRRRVALRLPRQHLGRSQTRKPVRHALPGLRRPPGSPQRLPGARDLAPPWVLSELR